MAHRGGAQHDDQSKGDERVPNRPPAVAGVDVPPESEAADRAGECRNGQRSPVGEEVPVERNEQRDLPHEHETRGGPSVRHKQQNAGQRSPERADGARRHLDVRGPQQRQSRERCDDRYYAERDARPEGDEHPTGRNRARDADNGSDRLAHADLMTAQLIVAECREVRVIRRPIDRVADGRDGNQHRQRDADAMHLGQKRILRGAEQGSDDHHCAQAVPYRAPNDERANDQTPEQDQRQRDKSARQRNPRLQKIYEKKRTAAGQRDAMNPIM